MFELKVFNKMEKTLRFITHFGQHEWIILIIIFFIKIFFYNTNIVVIKILIYH
jgi:hypothetical protein